jgi:uncharacterized DUF497 family protein
MLLGMDIASLIGEEWFEWDSEKARANREKHGVTFEEAAGVFSDPLAEGGDASVPGEAREFIVGFSGRHRLLFVVYIERRGVRRLISARPVTRAKRRLYERR